MNHTHSSTNVSTKKQRIMLIVVVIVFAYTTTFTIFHTFAESSPLPSPFTQKPVQTTLSSQELTFDISYSLDNACNRTNNDSQSQERARAFENIYETGAWGKEESRSGGGSSIEGAFDWIRHLRLLINHLNIQSIADIPCGDTYWQFSIREMNTIQRLYFGGDIADYVIQRNRRLYATHRNKIFQKWDIVRCPLPTFTMKNASHTQNGSYFDLVIIRDALQHMHIRNGLQAVRNIVSSGAKYIVVSSYPPNNQAPSHSRSIGKNETLPTIPSECDKQDYCQLGSINDGNMYSNNINCPPFNFPLHKAVLIQPSHKQFLHENDEIHAYRIDEELKQIVQNYEKACLKS